MLTRSASRRSPVAFSLARCVFVSSTLSLPATVPGPWHRARRPSSSSALAMATPASVEWVALSEANSTQDEARRLLAGRDPAAAPVLAVFTTQQTRGRGTRGRQWLTGDGGGANCYLTVAAPISRLPLSPITLVPLRVGTLVAPVLASALRASTGAAAVTLKWPNDVLLGGGKVGGVLIEMENDHLLIGIGVNVGSKPAVPLTGADGGRPAACLADLDPGANATRVGHAIAAAVGEWAVGPTDPAEAVRADWSRWHDWEASLKLRDDHTRVVPVALEADGSLRVAEADRGGVERTLVAEYLW